MDPSADVPKIKLPIASRDLSLNKLAMIDAEAEVSCGCELLESPSRNIRILLRIVHGITYGTAGAPKTAAAIAASLTVTYK